MSGRAVPDADGQATDEEDIEAAIDATLAPPIEARRFPQDAFNRLPPAVRALLGVAFATLGGFVASRSGVPLGWLLGALFSCGALATAGFSLPLPAAVRQIGQTIAGFSVGVFFTPEVGQRVLELGGLMIAGGCASILISVLISIPLARAGGCDRKSAFFAMMPGGLAEMAGLAQQFGANVTVVSVSQSLRVVIIVLTIPPALTLLSGGGHGPVSHLPEMPAGMLAPGLGLAGLAAFVFARLRIFNAYILGGLAVGIAAGLIADRPQIAPSYAPAIAQVAIGSVLGARFSWSTLRKSGARFLPATILATALLILGNMAVAGLLSQAIPFATGVLATSPGGIAEMSLTAEALHLAPPLVVAWHIVRILLVAVLTGPIYKVYRRWC